MLLLVHLVTNHILGCGSAGGEVGVAVFGNICLLSVPWQMLADETWNIRLLASFDAPEVAA